MLNAPELQLHTDMQQCIQNCMDCHGTCLNVLTYCIEKGGRHAHGAHLRLMQDCADICQTGANFMLRGSEYHMRTCAVCAEICEKCAADCERLADDPHLKACARACRRCAESCHKMAESRR